MAKQVVRRFANQRGQGLVEYLILVALMAVASLAVVRGLSHVVQTRFANAIYALQGTSKRAKTESLDDSAYQKRDLSDFMNGAASGKSE